MDDAVRFTISLPVILLLAFGCNGGGPEPRHRTQRLFFSASDAAHGRELWTSDGTAAGTRMVADVVPGERGLSPQHLIPDACGGVLFSGDDGIHGPSLWSSDGTEAGTVLLEAGLTPGSSHAVLAGRVYLVLCDRAEACALWRTDGTETGTVMVKDGVDRNAEIEVVGAYRLFFAASDGAHGKELWTSTGAAEGTRMVADVVPGEGSLSPHHLTALLDGVLFAADDGIHGPSLWRSDGTEAGTVLVEAGLAQESPFVGTAWIRLWAVFCDPEGTCALWGTDGTEAGTAQVSDLIDRYARIDRHAEVEYLDGSLFFPAADDAHGEELWTSFAGEQSRMVADVVPGAGSLSPRHLYSMGRVVLFSGDDGVHGPSLWKSDGTEAGTTLVKAGFAPEAYAPGIGATAFTLLRESGDPAVCGLWETDGTELGTVPLAAGLECSTELLVILD